MPNHQQIDWSTVKIDPARMTPEERAGFEYFTDWLVEKLAEHRARATAAANERDELAAPAGRRQAAAASSDESLPRPAVD